MKDEYALVLDVLPLGHSDQRRAFPIAQVIGEVHFNLLELVPREGVEFKMLERIYIGSGVRDKVQSIKKKLTVPELTATAQSELPNVVENLVEDNEKKFIDFFNTAGPLTTRQHKIEIVPGIGKKHLWALLDERKKEPFKSFEDMEKRVHLLPNPKKAVIKRILGELEGQSKWYLFVGPPKREF